MTFEQFHFNQWEKEDEDRKDEMLEELEEVYKKTPEAMNRKLTENEPEKDKKRA